MQRDLADHYDRKYAHEIGQSGRGVVLPTRYPVDRFERCVISLATKLPSKARVLELGAGDGTIAASLLHARSDITMVVSDSSSSRVKGLANRFDLESRAQVLQLDIETTPIEGSESFDAVVLVALIEHFVDPLGAMTKINSLLRPSGIAYIDTPNIAKWTRRIKLLFGRFPSTASKNEGLSTYQGGDVDLHEEGHLHYFTFRSLSPMLMSRCGFESVSYEPYWDRTGQVIGSRLARFRPQLFSELALVAHKPLQEV